MTELASIFVRACAALEAEDHGAVQAAMSEARSAATDGDDVRIRYLEFMSRWLDEDASEDEVEASLEGASELFEGATRLANGAEAARIVLDLADILVSLDDVDDAEHALRALTERQDLSPEAACEARLLRAHVLLDFQEDPEEALTVLEGVHPSLREEGRVVSLSAAVLIDLDREDDAVELLDQALTRDDNTELRYQLGVVLTEAGEHERAIEHLLRVRELDLAMHEVEPDVPVPTDEAEDLRRHLEDMLDTLPDPVISRVAAAVIRVERWASEAAIRGGCDPRTTLSFEGQPSSENKDKDGAGQPVEGHVDALVIYRDAVIAQIDDDDEIGDALVLSLVEEFDRYFGLELIPGM